MLTSNNDQMRCNFVDLYYALFGVTSPAVLTRGDSTTTMGLPRIPKLSKRLLSPTDFDGELLDDRRHSTDSDRHFKSEPKIKDEMIDRDEHEHDMNVDYRHNDNDGDSRPSDAKKMKTDYGSDNSVSLPGMSGGSGPIGFEPGMFKSEDDNSQSWKKSDSSRYVHGFACDTFEEEKTIATRA